jgi:oxygen-dependent protoporphyrinogen oxidase
MTHRQIVVVGAGIAGLTAAYRLKKAGHDVLVLEAKDFVGGRMFTVEWEGFLVDGGAKFVTTSDHLLLDIVREVGLEDQLVQSNQGLTITIYRDGKMHSANFLSIPSYFGWSGVSLNARLAMLKLIPHFLRLGRLKSPYHLEQAMGADDDTTFEEFFKTQISEEMFEYWAIPMFETMCAYKGDHVSRKAFLAMMASYLNASTVTFKGGIGVLPEKLASLLDVEVGACVQKITPYPDGSGAEITYRVDGQTRNLAAERVVVALPGNHVLALFDDPRPAWVSFFPKVGYSTGALQYHICETDYQPTVPGTFVPRSSKFPINSVAFEKYQDGRWLLLTDPSVYTFKMDEEQAVLVGNAMEIATLIYPALKGTFAAHKIFRWQEKVPTFRPGYLDALARFWNDPQEKPVFFCGDYFAGPSTGGALFTGYECSERVLASVES